MLTDFQNSFTNRLSGKFATNHVCTSHHTLNKSLHCHAKCEMSEKWRQSEICILINDRSQDSAAKHWSRDGFLHYKLIVQFAGERIIKIAEHLAKIWAKWLLVSHAPFALHFCPQRCWSRQISKITSVLRTEPVTNCCYVNRQINVSLLSTNIKLL